MYSKVWGLRLPVSPFVPLIFGGVFLRKQLSTRKRAFFSVATGARGGRGGEPKVRGAIRTSLVRKASSFLGKPVFAGKSKSGLFQINPLGQRDQRPASTVCCPLRRAVQVAHAPPGRIHGHLQADEAGGSPQGPQGPQGPKGRKGRKGRGAGCAWL